MKGFQKHKVVVARRDYVANTTTFYYVDAMVQPLRKIQGFETQDNLFSTFIDGHILYTKSDKPTVINVDETPSEPWARKPSDLPIPRSDMVYWDNKWYYVFGEADYIKFSNGTHRRVQLITIEPSGDNLWLKDLVPPAFQTEYLDFLEAVGQTTTVIELGVLPLSNKPPITP